MTIDVLVLGAGMVGVSAALHLQARGRQVVLADRRGPAEETSYGNAGIIQLEGIVPYSFPRDIAEIAKSALNVTTQANLHYSALPDIASPLMQYWQHGAADKVQATAKAMAPIVRRCLVEHEAFMREAGISGMLRREGYLRVYRTEAAFATNLADAKAGKADWDIAFETKSPAEVAKLEPHLAAKLAGGIFFPEPASVGDPGAVGRAYADLFVKRGGRIVTADARTLEPSANGGWQIAQIDGPLVAREVVIALGAWSEDVLKSLGVHVPLFVKRGYHMHFTAKGNATLSRPVVDDENGYVITSMTRGIRLTTGAEFARLGAPATPTQLARVEPLARELFPLDSRVEAKPWLGNRPCLPDMVPMIGRVPGKAGMWADFGHHHLGFTLGPVSGRLLAEMMTGTTPFTDPAPYRVERFA